MPPKTLGARVAALELRSHDRAAILGDTWAWTFPILLTVVIVSAVLLVTAVLDLQHGPAGEALATRLAWGTTTMLFLVLFAFTLIVCVVLMFKCGRPTDAVFFSTSSMIAGVVMVLVSMHYADEYLGPAEMHKLLNATALCLTGVRSLTSFLNGCAIWSGIVVIATSAVIIRHEVTTAKDLSRQLRASKMLMYVATALLVTGVSETAALHRWPAHDSTQYAQCRGEVAERHVPLADAAKEHAWQVDFQKSVETTATAISASVGTVFSLVLAAAYLPLGILLRQRAYRVIDPWERTEAWLAVHGFALQPTQQLAKVLMILSPLLAGGPISYLISLLSSK